MGFETKKYHFWVVLGLGYQFQSFKPQIRPRNQISRSGICHQNCYRYPFFRHFNPPKGYERQPHRVLGEVFVWLKEVNHLLHSKILSFCTGAHWFYWLENITQVIFGMPWVDSDEKNIDQSEQSLLLLVEKSILTVTTLILICCQQSSIYCWFRGPRAASHTLGLPEIMDIYIVTYPLKNIMAWFTSTRGV